MKNIRKIAAIVVAFALVLSIAIVPASAARSEEIQPTSTEITTAHEHDFELFGKGSKSLQLVCKDCGTFLNVPTDDFVCEHQFASEDTATGLCMTKCTKCGYSVQKQHEVEFFWDKNVHGTKCAVCGYTSAEDHEFVNEFDATSHWERCEVCDFTRTSEHVIVDTYDNNTHYRECEECGYTAGMHHGVQFYATSAEYCYANCRCGEDHIQSHDWNGFVCRNCEFELTGPTGAIVRQIRAEDDGVYRIRVNVNGENHYFYLDDVTFEKGDFVIINHNGNEIESIKVMVQHDICEDPDNPHLYLNEQVYEDMGFGDPTNNVVNGIYHNPNNYQFNVGTMAIGVSAKYTIVYDFENGRQVDLDWICEDERLVWFYIENQIIILDYCN